MSTLFLPPQQGPTFGNEPPATESLTGAPAPVPGEETQPEGPGIGGFAPFIVIGVLFWFLIIAPERKNRKKRQVMLSALAKGDEVMTTGGLFGRVSKVGEHEVTLVVADGVRMRFSRAAVQGLREETTEEDVKTK